MTSPPQEGDADRVIQSLRFSRGAVEITFLDKSEVREGGKSYLMHNLTFTRATHPQWVAHFEHQTDLLLSSALKDWEESAPTVLIPDSATDLRAALRYKTRTLVKPDLTPKQEQVLALIVAGKSASHIGVELGMAVSTVKSHTAGIYEKLGAHNRASATMAAIRLGLIAPE